MSKTSYDYCILGAGLAGISLADALTRKGADVCVIDSGEIASGASGTPLGLVNPATGRYGTKSWKAEQCYHAIYSSLKETQAHSSKTIFRKSGVLRPALDEKIAGKMKENIQNTSWPDNWCNWLDEKDIRNINPEISSVEGGLWLPVGLTVDIAAYLKNKSVLLQKRGVSFKTEITYQIKGNSSEHFTFSFGDGSEIQAANIIHTSGYDTVKSNWWKFLKLNPVKGQVAVFKSPSPLQFDYAISALGYIASLDTHQFVVGSTYEHTYEHENPDEQGLEYLTKRMTKVYPKLMKSSKLINQWAGVRASTPNRKPVLGQHPEKDNCFVFAGLGSKGLLYSMHLAQLMADYLAHSSKLPEELSIERFSK